MHHVAYEVDDFRGELARLQGEGAELIDAAPRPGLFGMQVAFVHPTPRTASSRSWSPVAERVRIEIGFDGGQVMGALVEPATADALEQALGAGQDGAFSLDVEDGRYTVALRPGRLRQAFLPRGPRRLRLGCG